MDVFAAMQYINSTRPIPRFDADLSGYKDEWFSFYNDGNGPMEITSFYIEDKTNIRAFLLYKNISNETLNNYKFGDYKNRTFL